MLRHRVEGTYNCPVTASSYKAIMLTRVTQTEASERRPRRPGLALPGRAAANLRGHCVCIISTWMTWRRGGSGGNCRGVDTRVVSTGCKFDSSQRVAACTAGSIACVAYFSFLSFRTDRPADPVKPVQISHRTG